MNAKNPKESKINLDIFSFSYKIRILLVILFCFFLIFTAVVGFYVVTYFLFIIVFLFIASSLGGFRIIGKMVSLPRWQQLILVFSIALALRCILLVQSQVITLDIVRYIGRSENMLDGQIPYRDFYGGNKPPLYEFMLYIIGLVVTPGKVQFRFVFSIFDALIPLVLLLICVNRYNDRFAVIASLTYAIFPISIICIGLSGHYDPVVALFSLIAILMLFRNKLPLSGLSLGVSFALKIYPIVLLPFFLTTIPTWRKKVLYVIYFAIPTIIADGILYLISPSAFFEYLTEESEWMGCTAFAGTIEMMCGASYFLTIKISWIILGIFGILILLLLMDWIFKDREKILIKWFKIIILIFVIYYGAYLIWGIRYYGNPVSWALFAAVVYFPLAIFITYKALPIISPKSLDTKEGLLMVSVFAIMLFMFGLPNYAPWYFIWFFPFLLTIKTDKIRYSLLWVLPWHGLGVDVSLLPGTPAVNWG
jgi:hypothetical protein